MSVTIVQKSQGALRRKPRLALVLSGGAISGGAFKIGGLIAVDTFFTNLSVCDCDIYMGISAGSFLAAPLAAGIRPQDILRSFTGRSATYTSFNAWDFYWPNIAEVADKGRSALQELASLYPSLLWTLARMSSKSGPLAFSALRKLLGKGEFQGKAILARQKREVESLIDQLPSLMAFIPSGVFDNAAIERYLRKNLIRARIPNNFSLLQKERGKALYIHAVDLDTAQDVVFGPDERNDVTISEAVQASTALPGFYKPALIAGRYYIDGNAKQTAPIELAMAKGADLIFCYNPFRPFTHAPNKSLSKKYSSLGEMGLSKVIDQSIRTLLHSRLALAIEDVRNQSSFHGDLVVVEPAESDKEFFSINPLSFWGRADAARHGFTTVYRDIQRNLVRLQNLLGRYGIQTSMARLEFIMERLGDASSQEQIVEILSSPPVPQGWQG
jgi:NTE family protein